MQGGGFMSNTFQILLIRDQSSTEILTTTQLEGHANLIREYN